MMTLAIGLCTPTRLSILAIEFTRLAWLVLALLLTLAGLAFDAALGLGPFGTVAVWPAAIALGLTGGVAILEIKEALIDEP